MDPNGNPRSGATADELSLWLRAWETAKAIVNGDIPPLDGAEQIALACARPLHYPGALMPFVNAALQRSPHPRGAQLDQIAADIRRAACALLCAL